MNFNSSPGQGRLGILICLLLFGCWSETESLHAGEMYRVKYPITVGSSDHPVQLKTGDTVEVMSIHGLQAVIMMTSANGDKTVCQTDLAALDPMAASPPAATPASGTGPAPAPAASSSLSSPAPLAQNPGGKSPAGDLAKAVVVIKGDRGEGTGFLVKTAIGPAVVTNLHVLSANPNVTLWDPTGAPIKILSLKGAVDRDLAMISIQDNHYTYLYLANDIKDTVQPGDEVITPGNSEGGEVVINTTGTVLGIGPVRIEITNPVYHGNSGGPIFHSKSGKVLGVVTQGMKTEIRNDLDESSFKNKQSAIKGDMRYFGLRLDNVPQWEDYDWNRFLNETTLLEKFHQESRCLDSFMNGAAYEKKHLTNPDGESGEPDAKYFERDEKIETANQNFHQATADATGPGRLDAVRELVMDLQDVADDDMMAMQNPDTFYSFDRLRAKEEIQYRKALRGEIDHVGGRVSDLGH
jgi:hypothetical protein